MATAGPPNLDALEGQLVEAWRTNNRINLLLIDGVSDEGMDATLSTRGGRGVRGEFAHMHTIRVWHIEKRAKDLAKGLKKYSAKDAPSRAELKKSFEASGDAVEQLLVGSLRGAPKRSGFRKGIFTTLSYFVSHESHHRGRILLTLKVRGHTLDKALQSRIWGWDQL